MQPLKFASDANGRDALPRVRGGVSKNRRNAKPKNAALFAYHPGSAGAHPYHARRRIASGQIPLVKFWKRD